MLAHRLARPLFTRRVVLARAFATKPPHAPLASSEAARKQAADKIVKEYLDSTKPAGANSSGPTPTSTSRDIPTNTAPTATASTSTSPPNVPPLKAEAKPGPQTESPTTKPPESKPPIESKPAQNLALWKDATLNLLRSRAQKAGAEAAVQFNELGGKLNQVTGYDRIEELKRRVVEREHSIASLRGAARDAKQAYTTAVATRAARQRDVNDLLQRKSTWTDSDVHAFTQLVRQDHLSASTESQAKTHLERTEAAVDAEFGALMRAILDRYHEEQVWSDKIRSVSTYGSLAALVVNVVVFVAAIVVVEPWKRKRLAQTFEQRIVEMSGQTKEVVESGIRGLEGRLERQEEVLAGLGQKVVPEPEPKHETEPVPAPPRVLPPWLNESPVVDQAKAWLAAVKPETDRDYALLALGGLGSLIGSGLVFLGRHLQGTSTAPSLMHGKDHPDGISISCRFLATDQWLRAHVDPSWTIFELKRHLLAKCVGGVPLAMGAPGPRLLKPSQAGLVTLAGLVQAPYTSAIKTGRPNTAPHDDSRRKPRLSLKVVPGLTKPPRTVTIHPPTPALFGPSMMATGPQPPPPVYFAPELSPPVQPEDESSPSSPNTQHDTMSNASRSTVALPYSQPQSHTTSPTYSAGASPPSRPFSPTSLPRAETTLEFSTLLRARSTPPLSRALSSPPSPYSPPLTSRPFPLPTSPPVDARIDASQISVSDTADSIAESTNSPLLSAAEFFDLDAQEPQDVLVRSPSPPTGLVSASSGSTVFATRSVMPVENEAHSQRKWEDAFRIASFSQGCLLEEHSTVADLRIRPGELLEIQRVNAAVHLSRPTYTQPYFEAPVYLIKRTPMHYPRPQTSHHPHPLIPAARPHQHHIQPTRDYASRVPEINPPMSPVESTTRVRSRTVTARDVHDNMSEKWDDDGEQEWAELELSGLEGIGEANGRPKPPSENQARNEGDKIEWKVRWLTLREGMFSLSRSRSKQAQPLFSRPVSSVLTAQQLPAVPSMGHLPRNYISIHFTGISRKERERERDCDIGIRMMDGAAHAHLFRVLLRIINTPGTHTFLPTDTPYFSSPPLSSQYPEWRQYIVQRAWLAGRATSIMHGLVVAGPWMRAPWIAWTDKEAECFEDDTSQYGDEYETDSDDASQLYESQIGAVEGYDQQRDSDSDVEWDVEGWRAWESENAFGSWTSSAGWLKHRVDAVTRPRSRSLAAPSSRSSSLNQPKDPASTYPYPSQTELLSPVSTSSEISTTSPGTRRARSSTIAVPPPESPTGSPSTWSPTLGQRRPLTSGAGIETVLRTPTASQSRRSEPDRRGSTTSLEMQRAHPSRRAVTSPPPGAKFP